MASPAVQWGFQQITVTGLAVATLTLPAGAVCAVIHAVSGNVRYRLDGVNPTATVGQVLVALADRGLEIPADDVAYAKFILSSGSATATLEVHYRLNKAG